MILVVAEQRDGKLNRSSWETVAAAQQLGRALTLPVTVLVPGANAATVANELVAAHIQGRSPAYGSSTQPRRWRAPSAR